MPVVLDPHARLPLDCRLLRGRSRPVVVVSQAADVDACDALRSAGATLLRLPVDARGRMDPADVLHALGRMGVRTVLVEGGAHTHGGFADAGLVDEVVAFVAPTIIGGADAPGAVGGLGADTLGEALSLCEVRVEAVGDDVMVRGHVRRAAGTVLDVPHASTPSTEAA